jgi:excisionase family DNA binding protein
MSVTEAAAQLAVSRQRVLVLIQEKKLRAKRIGNYYLVDRQGVEKRIFERQGEPTK